MNPFQVVKDFEAALCEYTGAPYCVTVNSCTAALRLALLWERKSGYVEVGVPRRTYPSVPMAAVWAGLRIKWFPESYRWEGTYVMTPTRVVDCAKRLRGGMYIDGWYMCVSFHPQKPLGISNGGGAILHSDYGADSWFRHMRFDGRTESVATVDDAYTMIGEHCYMMPATAAEGLHRLSIYAKQRDHADQPSELDLYPDLSKWEVFK
jgi:dTDP-4-amino-4,6-dideoxygalactose transaminase